MIMIMIMMVFPSKFAQNSEKDVRYCYVRVVITLETDKRYNVIAEPM